MIKRFVSLLLLVFFCVSLPLCVSAKETDKFIIDQAGLLTDSEEKDLKARLAEISEEYDVQMTVVTVSALEFNDIETAIEAIYDSGKYGYGDNRDGIMLLVSMDIREFSIVSNGLAGDAISDSDIESILDEMESDMANGDYSDAFETFADECEYYLNGYINGFPFEWGTNLVIALVIGVIIAWIVCLIFKGQLKSVRRQYRAADYVRDGSLQITQSLDLYLYSNVTRRAKPKNNSSSGSGSSRSVGSRSF